MQQLALELGGKTIAPPSSIPQGGLDFFSGVLGNAITLFLIFAVVISLIFIVWGGIQWTTSGGDKGKISAARAKLTWAIVGLIIVFLSFFIINILAFIFKVDLLKISST